MTADLGFGPVELSLAEGRDLRWTLGGIAAGLLLQRLADPEASRGAWLRAAPWAAALAALMLVEIGTPPGVETCSLLWYWGASVTLAPAAAVALVQIAAAVAARGGKAPLGRAAPWARLLLLVPVMALAYKDLDNVSPYMAPPARKTLFVACAAAAALLALARRRSGPGASLLLASAVAATWIASDVQFGLERLAEGRAVDLASTVLTALTPLVAVLFVRRLRLDRRALAALGIDLGAPGDVAAVWWVVPLAAKSAAGTIGAWLSSGGDSWATGLVAGWLAGLAAIAFALVYLRRRLDEGEARRAAREARAPGGGA